MRGEEKRGKGEAPKRVTEKYAEIVSTRPTSLKKELYGGFHQPITGRSAQSSKTVIGLQDWLI